MAKSPNFAISIFKKTLKIIGLTLIAIPLFFIAQNRYLNHTYQSITLPISVDILQNQLGKPDAIELEDNDSTIQNWIYHMPSFAGEGYIFVIKNNVATERYHLVSP